MAIAALSTAGFSQYVAASSNVPASQQAWQSLQQSMASGNLSSAQTAFNTYNQLNQNTSSAADGSTTSPSSQLSTDMTALGSAISSGNLSTAQSAFTTVQNDLKSAPSQSVTNAETAVNQTVQWVDDLLNLSGSDNFQSAPVDPTTSILDSAYGLNSTPASTDPTASILNSAYGANSPGSTNATAPAASNPDASSAAAPVPLANGNAGSAASVNVYA
jgi:ribosomal protein S20